MQNKSRKPTMVEKITVIIVLLIVALVSAPHFSTASNPVPWREAKNAALQIRQQAFLFCMEKGEGWIGWEDVTIYDMGINYKDLDGEHFKHDSYSIKFYSYNDFVITAAITDTTNGCDISAQCIMTLDQKCNWEYVE